MQVSSVPSLKELWSIVHSFQSFLKLSFLGGWQTSKFYKQFLAYVFVNLVTILILCSNICLLSIPGILLEQMIGSMDTDSFQLSWMQNSRVGNITKSKLRTVWPFEQTDYSLGDFDNLEYHASWRRNEMLRSSHLSRGATETQLKQKSYKVTQSNQSMTARRNHSK